jgi:hypothetical protein
MGKLELPAQQHQLLSRQDKEAYASSPKAFFMRFIASIKSASEAA